MIPILDSTALVATGSKGMSSSGPNTLQGGDSKQFGAILSTQEGVLGIPETAAGPTLDQPDVLATSGNILPSGGKSLPMPSLSSDLELTAEAAIALRAVSVGADSMPESVPDLTLAPLFDSSAALPEEASESAIGPLVPVTAASVLAVELEEAPAPVAPAADQSELAGPIILPADALIKSINTANVASGYGPGQNQLPAATVSLPGSPPVQALTGDPDPYRKAVLADAEFSVVTSRAEIAVEVADTLKGVDLLSLKTAPANASSAAQPVLGAPPAIAETTNTGSGVMKSGVATPLSTPVGHPGWSGEFASRIGVMVKNGLPEASLQLSPAELGRLDIKISTDGDQAKVVFTVQNMAAREAIEQAMPRLRDMLEQSGLQLAHSEVADHSQSRQQGEGMINTFSGESIAESEELSPEMSSMPLTTASDAMVDYYV